ncbi:hypothetical protein M8C21_032554 [Ambrosia artemisiifolia]|uniref:phosphopyruvate hydratase n=1 Tax=Ambrosia artemisiifolia TaxID=4212 RepID=A0AAD5GLR6_AMBAR|nr:hypothetical protein M8C21_032554 [Ambrosia artemisiifolia]
MLSMPPLGLKPPILFYSLYGAIELRDGDKAKYLGNGVSKAVKNINEKISEAIVGMDPSLQNQIDQAMIDLDKTEKKGELGANAILAVSIAACRAGAAEKDVPLYKHIAELSGGGNHVLPVPAFTLISGGKHAGNNLAIREIMILPVGAQTFEEAMQMGSETYHHLKVNQLGTVTEAIEVVKMAKDAKWGVVISQRSGETDDSFLADLSVGLATGQIKAGAPCRGERLAKYNQLIRIEEEIGDQASYVGENWRHS